MWQGDRSATVKPHHATRFRRELQPSLVLPPLPPPFSTRPEQSRAAVFLSPSGGRSARPRSGEMARFTVRGVDIELEWELVVEVLLWCLPLFVIGALVRDRVAKGYRFDLAADAAVAVAAVVSAAAVVIRYCRHRCPAAVALVRIRKEIRSMQV